MATEGSRSSAPGKVALLIVDVQNDFLPGDAVPVPDDLLRLSKVKDALAQGFQVCLPAGAIKALDQHGGEAAMAEMVERCARLTTLAMQLEAQRAAVPAMH